MGLYSLADAMTRVCEESFLFLSFVEANHQLLTLENIPGAESPQSSIACLSDTATDTRCPRPGSDEPNKISKLPQILRQGIRHTENRTRLLKIGHETREVRHCFPTALEVTRSRLCRFKHCG